MNAAPLDAQPWSRRRWLGFVALILAAQILLLWKIGERPRPNPPPAAPGTPLALAAEDAWLHNSHPLNLPSDPTVLALPNPHGFSGAAWFNFRPLEHDFSDWTEPPRWLPLRLESLGRTFSSYVTASRRSPQNIADVPYSRPLPDLAVPPDPLPTASSLLLSGDLARRPFLSPPTLPTWTNTDILSNTVVEALINSDGDAISAVVLEESGLPAADQFARQLAAQARFAPEPPPARGAPPAPPLISGRIHFRWHTAPAADISPAPDRGPTAGATIGPSPPPP